MKAAKDLFSKQSSAYKKYRPTYPDELYDLILEHTPGRSASWDVGCGNGQVAAYLANHFDEVQATDVSENQISLAVRKPNIQYSVGRAEKTNFKDQSIDLITVGQAIHWFDHEAFNEEVKRVLKPGGTLAFWCYELSQTSPEIDTVIWEFYTDKIGSYWAPERRHIDEHYSTIPFPFEEVRLPDTSLTMKVQWSLDAMEGYLNSWSSVQKYIQEHHVNPVGPVTEQLAPLWKGTMDVVFPLQLKIGKV
ncbi:MAG: class I SAM-dependent methyltransferase [Cytophagales bacterium]|nr:class I SAM-dependent methyltransferase [Cytophagales bacterium]